MRFEQWEDAVPEAIKGDRVWGLRAYRLALFMAELAWHDIGKLAADRRMLGLADQLFRSVGAISADLTEGYSRSTGKDRARFYEFALGSAREARDWYYKGRHVLGETVVEHRHAQLVDIIRLTITMIAQQRPKSAGERLP